MNDFILFGLYPFFLFHDILFVIIFLIIDLLKNFILLNQHLIVSLNKAQISSFLRLYFLIIVHLIAKYFNKVLVNSIMFKLFFHMIHFLPFKFTRVLLLGTSLSSISFRELHFVLSIFGYFEPLRSAFTLIIKQFSLDFKRNLREPCFVSLEALLLFI